MNEKIFPKIYCVSDFKLRGNTPMIHNFLWTLTFSCGFLFTKKAAWWDHAALPAAKQMKKV